MARKRKFIVNIGDHFGRLTVLREEVNPKDISHPNYLCQCSCGNTTIVRAKLLCKGITQSCGCLWKDTMKEIKEKQKQKSAIPIGTVSGNLTVIEDLGILPCGVKKEHCYKCKCVCGKEVVIRQQCLKRGQASCGCTKFENPRKVISEKAKKKREYPTWLSNFLVFEEEINGIKNKDYSYETKLHFRCSNCGQIVEKPISYIMRLNKEREQPVVLCLNCSNHRSSFEEEVYQYIKSIVNEKTIQRNIWGILRDGQVQYELDMYLPDIGVAIECNGDYFHSASYNKGGLYHQKKYQLAEDKGIHLIQIFESYWKSNKDKIKNYLHDCLGETQKVYARSCFIETVTKNVANNFYNENHIQGASSQCDINLGLYYKDSLISCMSFTKVGLHNPTAKKETYFELVRFSVKNGFSIIGGASRLLTFFEKEYTPSKLLSYSDNDFFTGKVYRILGFTLDAYVKPRYHWFMRDQTVRTRESCQLKYLSKQYPDIYNKALQEKALNKEDYIMDQLRAVKVYHSGNKRWIKEYKENNLKENASLYENSSLVTLPMKEEVKSFINSLIADSAVGYTDSIFDLFLEKFNLAFMFSSSLYNTNLKRPKNFYRDKFYLASEKGIRLISIFEMDWKTSKDKIKNLIKYSILPKERIPARKCVVKRVSMQEAWDFYNTYHIQNKSCLAKINYGLYYKDSLVAVMGFGSSSFHNRQYNEGDYELHRFVTKTGITVVGGASKLLSLFEREYHPAFLLSYSWNDWYDGTMYSKLGFTLDKNVSPDYFWILNEECLNKRKCRLKYLSKQYPELYEEAIEKNVSNKEDFIMESLGAVKVYRAGSKRWVKKYST